MTLAAVDRLVHHVDIYRHRAALERKQKGCRAATEARDNKGSRSIVAPRQSNANITLASGNHTEHDETVAVRDSHPDCRSFSSRLSRNTVRPAGCRTSKDRPIAVEQSSGRDRLNIHGAIDLETGRAFMKDVLVVDAASTIIC
jgi:hypothetical protein